MRVSANLTFARLFLRIGLAYAAVFAAWLVLAPGYHGFLAAMAGRVITVLSSAEVKQIRVVDRDDAGLGVGAHFDVVFNGRDPAISLGRARTLVARTETIVDIRQFGYPVITFAALALAWFPARLPRRALMLALGICMLLVVYSVWVAVEVFQYVAIQEVDFLQDTPVARWISPNWYQQHRRGLIVYLGQLIPIATFGLLCVPHWLATRSARSVSGTGPPSTRNPQTGDRAEHHSFTPRPRPKSAG